MSLKRQVLIASDDVERINALETGLREAGFSVRARATLEGETEADLLVADMTSESRWQEVEQSGMRRILIVEGPAAMRRGFALGAEDCVMHDARPEEITARCEAVLRRTDEQVSLPQDEEISVYVDRRLWVNFGTKQVWVRGRPAHLTPREFRLLEHLVRHRDEVMGHEQILEAVWGRESGSGRPTEVLKQYVWRLRQKIEPDPNQPDTILTEPGAGYRFVSRLD